MTPEFRDRFGIPQSHNAGTLRKLAVYELRDSPRTGVYRDFVDGDYDTYVHDLSRPRTWGDHLAAAALATALGVVVVVRSALDHSEVIAEITPVAGSSATIDMPGATDPTTEVWEDDGDGGRRRVASMAPKIHVAYHVDVHYDALLITTLR